MDKKESENGSYLAAFKKVDTFVFDMDGVLTDGSLLVMEPDGNSGKPNWYRTMNVKDGYALQYAVRSGYNIIIVSGSASPPVADRLRRLGIEHIFFDVTDKKEFLTGFFERKGMSAGTALFMGDDIPDLPAMLLCSLATCPADAAEELKASAHYISPFGGGAGCVRDVITMVMKLQNKWQKAAEIPST